VPRWPGWSWPSTSPIRRPACARARAFAEPLLAGETTPSGENLLAHADAVADILAGIGGAETIQAAAYLATPARS
jgi:GTP pyrophosphokinase